MQVRLLSKGSFAGCVSLTGLCQTERGALVASGTIGSPPDRGNLLKLDVDGAITRVGRGLRQSHAVALDRTRGQLIVSGNDGANGIFRIGADEALEVVTREIHSTNLPLATDLAGNLYYPSELAGFPGYSVVRRSADSSVVCVASGFLQIVGLAVDPDGHVYVADAEHTWDEGVLVQIRAKDYLSVRVICSEDGLRPHAVAVGARGEVFFTSHRGPNGDISEIYKVDLDGRISLIADGLVQGCGLAYNAESGVLHALNFLNFDSTKSAISKEYHNDVLVLAMTGEGNHVPAPFDQAAPPVQLTAGIRSIGESSVETGEDALKRDARRVSSQDIGTSPLGDGPAELARRLVTAKAALPPILAGPLSLSDESIHRLVDMAYHASCHEEEGRFLRFRIASGTNSGSRLSVRFAPFALNISKTKELRKLAPAAAFRGSTIVFDEQMREGRHTQLICRGICDAHDLISTGGAAVNSLEDLLTIRQPLLMIRAEGPAHLKASLLPGPVFSLRGGAIRQLRPADDLPCVEELFAELGGWLHAQLPTSGDKRVALFFESPEVLSRLVAKMWLRLLWHVSDRRRGGAFLILPRSKGHWRHAAEFQVEVGYPARIEFGKTLIDQVIACLRDTPSEGAGFGDLFRLTWDQARSERERITRMIADLANVDGCVVLDRRLTVLGFGGKIMTPSTPMKGLGTRHGSAKAWCSKHKGGMAFVISQDGDLRVFSDDKSSDDEPVDAGTSILDFC